jgi:hypothetical protein
MKKAKEWETVPPLLKNIVIESVELFLDEVFLSVKPAQKFRHDTRWPGVNRGYGPITRKLDGEESFPVY